MLSKVLGVAGRVLIVGGLVILGFVAYQLWGTGLEESRAQDELLDTFTEQLAADDITVDPPAEGAGSAEVASGIDSGGPPPTPAEGDPAAIIEIPRLDLSRVVVEGTSRSELKKGPGHYVGTPFPGQEGNVGIAGHRTTYGAPFNRIDELVPGDEVILSTSQGRFVYEVIPAPAGSGPDGQAWYAVEPSQVEVLSDVGDDRVTLTACHPKYSARQRIIVHARLREEPVRAAPASDADAVTESDRAEDLDEGLGSTPEELPLALGFGGAAALLAIGAWVVSAKFRRGWIAWVVVVPLALLLLWNGYIHMDRYLPAI